MGSEGFRPIFHFFWASSLLIGWMAGTTQALVSVDEFFPDLNDDLTRVTWAHGVNSRSDLKAALDSSVMMLEADILMGSKDDSEDANGKNAAVPVMAHPPVKTSDLTFSDFLREVMQASYDNQQGIKLDFKDIDAVKSVLKELNKKKNAIKFPVWLNADILNGPGSSTAPIDAKTFIDLTKKYFPDAGATLSLGWTTTSGSDHGQEKYSKNNIEEMLNVLNQTGINGDETPITFPVRASIAVKSVNEMVDLLEAAGTKSSITVWSKKGDTVDQNELSNLIQTVGKSRCYTDLPAGTQTPKTDFDDEDNHSEKPHDVSSSSLTSASVLGIASLLAISFRLF